LHILKQPAVPKSEVGLLSIWKNVGDPILDMRSDYTIPVYYFPKIFNIIIDRDYWRNKDLCHIDVLPKTVKNSLKMAQTNTETGQSYSQKVISL
jgi:hypothetical protein